MEDELNVSEGQLDLNRVKLYKSSIMEKKWSNHLSLGLKLSLLFFLICAHVILVI